MVEIVLMSDPKVTAIPVEECEEPLLDCRGALRVGPRRSDGAGDWAHLRAGVAQRLLRAQELLPHGWQWLLVEGYRSPATRVSIYDDYAATLRRLSPEASEAGIHTAAARWVAPLETAGHVSGAAVDLTLCTEDGVEIDMGSPEAATPEESDGACYTHASGLSDRAKRNRAVMIDALTAAGMVNYPTEWWHWSYGDRYWAWATGAAAACYGPRDRG